MEARAQIHPIWILEGFASLFETADFQDGRLEPMPNDRLNALKFFHHRGRLKPLATMLSVEQNGFMKDPAVYYAMSRYFLMYLHKKGKLREWYNAYTIGYDKDSTGRDALEKVFRKELDEIEEDWLEWAQRLPRPAMVVRTNQPYIGVAVSPATEGLEVQRVVPGSGADKAGLQAGDLIVRVGDRQLADGTELIRLVTAREVGQAVTIRYRRAGEYSTVSVKLQPKPARIPTHDRGPVRRTSPEPEQRGQVPEDTEVLPPVPARKAA
jgi:hypothetical protein